MSLVLCFLVLCASSAWAIRSAPVYDLEDAEFHFENFIKTHGKQYKDENEKQARFEIFKVNLEKINQANKGQNTTTFGNPLSKRFMPESIDFSVNTFAFGFRTDIFYGSNTRGVPQIYWLRKKSH